MPASGWILAFSQQCSVLTRQPSVYEWPSPHKTKYFFHVLHTLLLSSHVASEMANCRCVMQTYPDCTFLYGCSCVPVANVCVWFLLRMRRSEKASICAEQNHLPGELEMGRTPSCQAVSHLVRCTASHFCLGWSVLKQPEDLLVHCVFGNKILKWSFCKLPKNGSAVWTLRISYACVAVISLTAPLMRQRLTS